MENRNNNMFEGVVTAIITPFRNGAIDFASLEKIIEFQIANNIASIVVSGSTGEGNSLTFNEYRSLVQATVDIAKKRLYVIAGCSSSSTSFAIKMALESQKIGADGLLCAVPPYVKPTQDGIVEHFTALHNETALPIMLYSVPSRTGSDFIDETILKLSELPRILAFKDAGSDLERPLRLTAKLKHPLNLLSGNDEVALAYNAQGGVGCVSVASNIAPKFCREMQQKWKNGETKLALQIHHQLLPLYKALFAETNPIPVKYAASLLGLSSPELRLPLTEATAQTKTRLEKIIKNYL